MQGPDALKNLFTREKVSSPKKLTREMLFLAEQAAEGKLKVLPAKQWAMHYPADEATRAEKLKGLQEGRYTAEEAAHALRPDALLYDIDDIQKEGLEKVSARIRDLSAFITYYDYPRFARFVESMRGQDISLQDIDDLYGGLSRTRIQKKVMDSYGQTGRKQIEEALRTEANTTIQNIDTFSRSEKVLKALKLKWLSEKAGLVATQESDQVVSQLSGDERKLLEDWQAAYSEYVQSGDEEAFKKLSEGVREGLPRIQKEIEAGESSESMKELEKELEKYKEQDAPPGSPEDPAIPPEDNDEYHTPEPSSNESKEKVRVKAIFEITPPLGGYYVSGRKSYYNIDSKTWSKKKKLSAYSESEKIAASSTISGAFDQGLKSLPIPAGYALDQSSLNYEGAKPEILRDQNGCFYIDAKAPGSFSIDFYKETKPFTSPPISEDMVQLYRGSLSQKTEIMMSRFIGTPLQRAEQARQYILANHFYPGGGDLELAQSLQYKLRSESTGDNYLQNIDVSEYLECYSANTKFVAMMRKSGIPARLVIGHKVEGAQKGKSSITQNTGHAWSEIWDGNAWRRFDATPGAKPEDRKKEDNDKDKEKQDPAPNAQDEGVENPSSQSSKREAQASDDNADQKGEKGEGKKGEEEGEKGSGQSQEQKQGERSAKPTGTDSANPLDEMSDASDSQLQEAEEQLEQAKEQLEKMAQEQKELNDKVQKAETFKELEELKKQLDDSELFEDLKNEIKDKLEAKEDQMKDKIKDELDKMVEDGFMDENKREEILKDLEHKELAELDQLQKEVEQENSLYNQYENIREEISPLVDSWFEYFAERLPRQHEVNLDEDSLTRQGAFNRKAVMKSRNLLFGTVKNPREIRPSIRPRFMSSILVDVSGSMAGEKLKNAQKLLIFYSELFTRISEEFGYVHFSINTFSDSVTEIKGFEQEYASPQRYDYTDGTRSTVKVRLMQQMKTTGGTNMLNGIQKAAAELNKQVGEYPDYASAFYFVGDGGDTCGNSANITKFLSINETEKGFGEHMYSAILLGNESQRQELAAIFGDDHTNVAPDFNELIEKSMDKFEDDLEEYLLTKTDKI